MSALNKFVANKAVAAKVPQTQEVYKCNPGSPISFSVSNTRKLSPDVNEIYRPISEEEIELLEYQVSKGRVMKVSLEVSAEAPAEDKVEAPAEAETKTEE